MTAHLFRHPGEGRDPPVNVLGAEQWIPAFAGMTIMVLGRR